LTLFFVYPPPPEHEAGHEDSLPTASGSHKQTNMEKQQVQPQKVRPLAARLMFAALKILQENGGEMRGNP
jgi:hypothetical protein